MTPEMKVVLCNLVEDRIHKVMAEEHQLREVLRDLRSEPIVASAIATNGTDESRFRKSAIDTAPVPLHKPASANGPLETRLEQLREQHGPVFVIDPKNPVAAGQRIKWGKPEKPSTVEVLESAELGDKLGVVVGGRWFAKLVDV